MNKLTEAAENDDSRLDIKEEAEKTQEVELVEEIDIEDAEIDAEEAELEADDEHGENIPDEVLARREKRRQEKAYRKQKLKEDREELTRLREENRRFSAQLDALNTAPVAEAGEQPDPMTFESDADYTAAVAAWAAKKALADNNKAEIEARQKAAKATEDAQATARWQAQVAEIKQSVQDFDVVAYTAPISDSVAEMLKNSPLGAKIAYHLGKNPSEAINLSQMDQITAARTVGKLEAKLGAATAKPRKISNAPKPVETIETGSAGQEVDLSSMSMEEYRKHRQGAA